jgi:taurine dioxygenase
MGQPAVRQLGFALGGEVTGIDLRKPLNDLARREILDAWHRHLVLVFPGQDLSAAEQIAFSRNFGELEDNESLPYYRDPGHKEILLVTNKPIGGKPSETRNTGRNWHADLTYTPRPAKGSLLLCKEKPAVGGDTMWANLYLAYETLSAPLRDFLDKLEAIHDFSLVKGIEKRDPEKVAELRRLNPPVAHAVVKTHPETGRKSLFLGQRIRGFVGMTEEESAPLLDYLFRHQTRPEFTCRFRWRPGSLAFWDNRCAQHNAINDYAGHRRLLHRITLAGDTPKG